MLIDFPVFHSCKMSRWKIQESLSFVSLCKSWWMVIQACLVINTVLHVLPISKMAWLVLPCPRSPELFEQSLQCTIFLKNTTAQRECWKCKTRMWPDTFILISEYFPKQGHTYQMCKRTTTVCSLTACKRIFEYWVGGEMTADQEIGLLHVLF